MSGNSDTVRVMGEKGVAWCTHCDVPKKSENGLCEKCRQPLYVPVSVPPVFARTQPKLP